MTRYFRWAGGRKTGLGLLGAAILIIMGLLLDASFEAFAAALLLCLGITQSTVAYEDSRRPEGRSAEVPATNAVEHRERLARRANRPY